MKTLLRSVAVLALACASPALAGPLFSDPYGAGAPDVIGNTSDFDIRSLEVTALSPSLLGITILMNYHGGDATLGAFAVPGSSYAAVPLSAGDVLIQGATSLWAVPLSGNAGTPGGGIYYAVAEPVPTGTPVTRPALLPGSMYKANGGLTAGQVLGVDPASDLRADQIVLGNVTNPSPDFTGFFPIATPVGGGELSISLQVFVGAGFYDDVVNGYSVHFASTTCACDVLDGSYPAAAPEPDALALLGAAGAWLGLRRRRARA